MSVTTTRNTEPAGYVPLPRDLLVEAIEHIQGTRFDYPGHHLAPKLRSFLTAPTIAHATTEQRPLTDQRTLADALRRISLLVHVDELPADAGRLIVTVLLPHVTTDQWDELLHATGLHYDLDNRVVDWQSYDPDLPWQAEPRQAVATDLAGQDLEAHVWTLLNPGDTRCVDCDGPAERMATALPSKEVCGQHLTRRQAKVAKVRGLHAVGGAR